MEVSDKKKRNSAYNIRNLKLFRYSNAISLFPIYFVSFVLRESLNESV